MVVSSGLNTALAGVNKGLSDMMTYASKIAEPSSAASPDVLAESIIGLKSSQLQVQASASVVKAFDEALGTLIDIKV